MSAADLQKHLTELATELEVVGVSAGVYFDGEEHYAFHGVTNVDHPLAVDADTLFQFGSTGKTYTATAIMRLVEQGRVDLDAPVRRYVPEFSVSDEDVAARVTVLQLLNHTAGWDGDLFDDTGDGDDALEKYVTVMAGLQQVTPLGSSVSYNNAALCLAGRLIEKVTEKPYEEAIRELVLDPLGLEHTYFFPKEMMTRRFASGHTRHDDGTITVCRPWAMPRSAAPAGGMSATAADQLAWARFHLGDGTAPDGTRILPAEALERMKQPTADMRGSALGDHVGISWLLKDVDGTRVVGHGGTTNGQYSDFTMVPSRNFAIISMTNCGPNGSELNRKLETWAFEHYLGLVEAEPERLSLGDDALAPYVGTFETIASVVTVRAQEGRLAARVEPKPEMLAILREQTDEEIPDQSDTFLLAMLAGAGDRYVVAEGPAEGMRGYFARDAGGVVDGLHMGGRMATRR